MTQEELSKLHNIQKEIELIKREISNTDAYYVSDKVTGSSSSFPYTERSFKLCGYDYDSYYGKLKRLEKKLARKLDELMDERDKINDYINSIDDGVIRMILMCKYVNGMTWEQIGKEIGYSSKSIRRKHAKFFEKM